MEVYLVKTYQESLSNDRFYRALSLFKKISSQINHQKIERLGFDKYSNIKNKLPGGRPKIDSFQIHVVHGAMTHNLKLPIFK